MSKIDMNNISSAVAEILAATPEKKSRGGSQPKPWTATEQDVYIEILKTLFNANRTVKHTIDGIAAQKIIAGRSKQELWDKYREVKKEGLL
jgi:hypothetical protein